MDMEILCSTSNEKVKQMRALSDARTRKKTSLFRVEGTKMCVEAAQALDVDTVFVRLDALGQYEALLATFRARGAQVHPVPHRVLEWVTEVKTPQDLVLSARIPCPPVPTGTLIALDGVQDPGNCGAILRTCDAAGFGGVVLGAGCADPYAPKVVRSTMGSLFRVPLRLVPDLAAYLSVLKNEGYAVLVSSLDGDDFYARPALSRQTVLVIGSEGRGVSDAVAQTATHRYKLPMVGGAESLNASVAAGIMIYDLYRQFHYEI